MSQKRRFTPEPVTKPAIRRAKAPPPVRTSSPVPKSKRERSEAPTIPPPAAPHEQRRTRKADEKDDVRHSDIRSRRSKAPTPAATVDEVVADLSHDPRREQDEDD